MNALYSLCICRTFAAHVIVQFTLRLLAGDLFPLGESDVSRSLCGAFIFVCRQMYNTCEGLQILRPFGLHKAIAAAWQKVPAHKSQICFSAPLPSPAQRSPSSGELEEIRMKNGACGAT